MTGNPKLKPWPILPTDEAVAKFVEEADLSEYDWGKPEPVKHDWSRFNAMTEEEIHAAALSDPDAQPLTEEDFKRMKQSPRSKIVERALRLRKKTARLE